jgi:hypothetical protein
MTGQHNIEWKEIWKNDYLKWICGFANTQGGKPIIGKNDNGEIVGVENHSKLLEENLLSIGLNERQVKAVLYAKGNARITNSIYQTICKTSEKNSSHVPGISY